MSRALDYSKVRRPGAAQDLKVVGNADPGRFCWIPDLVCTDCGDLIAIGSKMRPGKKQPPAHYRCT